MRYHFENRLESSPKAIFLKLSRRERYIFYLSTALVLVVFFDRAILRPMTNKIDTLNRQILLEEKKLLRTKQLLSQKEAIYEKHANLTQALRQNKSDEEEKSELLSEIERMSRESSVLITDIKPLAGEKNDFYKSYTVEVEAESKIEQLVDFLYRLERSPRLVRVKNFYLSPKKQHSALLKARMLITEALLSPP